VKQQSESKQSTELGKTLTSPELMSRLLPLKSNPSLPEAYKAHLSGYRFYESLFLMQLIWMTFWAVRICSWMTNYQRNMYRT